MLKRCCPRRAALAPAAQADSRRGLGRRPAPLRGCGPGAQAKRYGPGGTSDPSVPAAEAQATTRRTVQPPLSRQAARRTGARRPNASALFC